MGSVDSNTRSASAEQRSCDLTPEEWQYISVLIAEDMRMDKQLKRYKTAWRHEATWDKIQPVCEWKYAKPLKGSAAMS